MTLLCNIEAIISPIRSRPGLIHFLDTSGGRALAQKVEQVLQIGFGTFGEDIDMVLGIVHVLHGAGQTQALGVAKDEDAKAHALHAAIDFGMKTTIHSSVFLN